MNALVLAFLAAIAYGVYYIILKRNLNHQHIWSYYALFFTVMFALLVPFHENVVMPSSGYQGGVVLIESSLLALYFIFTSFAYQHLESSEVSPLGNLGLVFSVLAGIFLFGESLSFLQMLGVLLMMMGAFVLEVGVHVSRIKKVFASRRHRKFLYFILLALFFSVFSNITEKILLDPASLHSSLEPITPFSLNFITRGLLMVFFLARAFLKVDFTARVTHVVRSVGWWVLVAAIIYNFSNIFYYAALANGKMSLVIPIAYLSSLFTTIIGGSLFHEHNLKQKVVGCAIMILATFLLVV